MYDDAILIVKSLLSLGSNESWLALFTANTDNGLPNDSYAKQWVS